MKSPGSKAQQPILGSVAGTRLGAARRGPLRQAERVFEETVGLPGNHLPRIGLGTTANQVHLAIPACLEIESTMAGASVRTRTAPASALLRKNWLQTEKKRIVTTTQTPVC